MIRSRVTSNAFRSIAYDGDTKMLEVEFHNGRRYQFQGVPHGAHYDFVNADSVGDHFHRNIKGRFKYKELGPPRSTKAAYEEPED
jgi:hypothetical protein